MAQSKIFLFVLALIAACGMAFVFFKGTDVTTGANSGISPTETAKVVNDQIIFYYGSTCPHCQEVEAWMEENKVEEKVEIEKKEVYGNKKNAQELNAVAQGCGILRSEIGVPFLKTEDDKCLVGTPDIKEYLSEKAGITPAVDEAS